MSTMPMWRQSLRLSRLGEVRQTRGESQARSRANAGRGRLRAGYPYFFAASAAIFSITIAVDPPRAYTLPLAVTRSPAKGRSFSF
jgi:hypothetical protein